MRVNRVSDEVFNEVMKVVDTYFKSVRTLDFKLMRSVAHNDGRIFLGNTSTSKNLHDHWADDDELLTDTNRVETLKKMKLELLTLQVDGTIAFVKIRMGNWLDYHILVKTLECWKFVDKVSHKVIEINSNKTMIKKMDENPFEEVKKVIDIYLKSVRNLDFTLMGTVTHTDGRIFLGNTSTSKNLHDHWADDNRRYTPEKKKELKKKMRVKLLALQVDDSIAYAKIRMGGWIDYHNLVKTTEGWKLINKVSHK
ncbi:MAG: nuclear transport factor 2 family protein, partial [Asgard group archaeon]|nr:nuclear transport factor 2 family protein [Asgard group archaeon]